MSDRSTARSAAKAAVGLLVVGLLAGCAGSSIALTRNVITITPTACGTGWRHPTAGVQTLQIHNAAASAVEVTLVNAYNGAVYTTAGRSRTGHHPGHASRRWVGRIRVRLRRQHVRQSLPVPTVHVPGHVRGGVAILPASANDMATVTEAGVGLRQRRAGRRRAADSRACRRDQSR